MKKKLLFVLSFFCLIFLFIAVGCNDNTPPADSDDGQTPSGESYTVTLVFDGARGSIELTPPAENNKYSKGTALTAAVTPLPGRVLNSFKADGEKKTLDGGKSLTPFPCLPTFWRASKDSVPTRERERSFISTTATTIIPFPIAMSMKSHSTEIFRIIPNTTIR